ncbi:hypothetical protein [Evtepia sp.]|uniref:hypothetical protein n=1 Tax=Evtepia sp. TaxID=2773933 RepID=UPI003F1870CB
MKLSVQVVNPAGNTTLLVQTPVPQEDRREVADRLLSIRELQGQQVGFLVPPLGDGIIRLETVDNAFCGNALCSAGLSYAAQRGFRRERKFPVEISGCGQALTVQVNPLTSQVWAETPVPQEIAKCTLFGEPARAVLLPGIVHGVTQSSRDMDEAQIRKTLLELCETFSTPAAGVLFWKFREKSMVPAVYTKDADALLFPGSSASGAAAIATWNAMGAGKNGSHKLDVRQPGGVISTTAAVQNGKLQKISIGGKVLLGPTYDVEF